jgi:glutamine amidotransferase
VTAVVLVDTPVANVANIARGLREARAQVELTCDPARLAGAAKIVLPGVGAFPAAMRWLVQSDLAEVLRTAPDRGTAILGVCVGHQLLFTDSDEMEPTAGLDLIPGHVRRLSQVLPIPQVGWNAVEVNGDPLFDGIPSGTPFYFVNSYRAVTVHPSAVIASADYGEPFVAAVRRARIRGVQFHPEKSSAAGLRLLRNFVEMS